MSLRALLPWLIGAGVAGFAVRAQLVLAERARGVGYPAGYVETDSAVGAVLLATGVLLWWRRPGNRTGPLLLASALAWFVGSFRFDDNSDVALAALGGQGYFDLTLAWAALAFPSGRLGGRVARAAIGTLATALVVRSFARVFLFVPPDAFECDCVENRFLGRIDASWYDRVSGAAGWLLAASLAAGLLVAAHRLWRAGSASRALSGIALTAWVVVAAGVAYQYSFKDLSPIPGLSGFFSTYYWVAAARIMVPIGFLLGLLFIHQRRDGVVRAVRVLGEGASATEARRALGDALRDPGVELFVWSPERNAFLGPDGATVEEPAAVSGRAVTRVEGRGGVLGLLRHDVALLEDPELTNGLASAVRLALENERMSAELAARLADVEASRRRIVEAGNAERRRIERNLHDGAQQRIISVALRLRMLSSRPETVATPSIKDAVDNAVSELSGALEDLRRLARGIHPAVLEEAGLSAAIEGLTDAGPIPVAAEIGPLPDVPEAAAITVYYVAAELLANVAKHARATTVKLSLSHENEMLRLAVIDDGIGGASARAGSGLEGVEDRVLAVGGTIRLESGIGTGTRVEVSVPCAS